MCHQQVIDKDRREACGMGEETSGHVFWECGKAQEVWGLTGITFETQAVRYREFMDLVWYLLFVQHNGDDFYGNLVHVV